MKSLSRTNRGEPKKFMYCESCGQNITQKLNYCNGCGSILSSASNLNSAKLSGLIWSVPLAVALLTLGGIGMLLNFRMEIMGREFGGSPAGGILLGIFVGILVIDWVLLRQLSRFIKSFQPPVNSGKQIFIEPIKHLPPTEAAPISAFVGENPTRLLEVRAEEAERLRFDQSNSGDLRARAAKTNSE